MKRFKTISVILLKSVLSCVVLNSCTMFETRSPEEPSGSGVPFQQPTSKDIVITNFKNAIAQRSEYNYIACFDTSSAFVFEPSADTRQNFPEQWTLEDERRSFVSLSSRISPVARFNLLLNNGQFSQLGGGADSVVYTADYVLRADHSDSLTIPARANGTMSLTIIARRESGLWSIRRWTDSRSEGVSGDTNSVTWSVLKAYFR